LGFETVEAAMCTDILGTVAERDVLFDEAVF
jgi:hypothetical protein